MRARALNFAAQHVTTSQKPYQKQIGRIKSRASVVRINHVKETALRVLVVEITK
jgi:hypothetical protein